MFDELEGILTARPIVHRAPAVIEVAVRTEPVVLAGESIRIEATVTDSKRVALQAHVFDEGGIKVAAPVLQQADEGRLRGSVDALPPVRTPWSSAASAARPRWSRA